MKLITSSVAVLASVASVQSLKCIKGDKDCLRDCVDANDRQCFMDAMAAFCAANPDHRKCSAPTGCPPNDDKCEKRCSAAKNAEKCFVKYWMEFCKNNPDNKTCASVKPPKPNTPPATESSPAPGGDPMCPPGDKRCMNKCDAAPENKKERCYMKYWEAFCEKNPDNETCMENAEPSEPASEPGDGPMCPPGDRRCMKKCDSAPEDKKEKCYMKYWEAFCEKNPDKETCMEHMPAEPEGPTSCPPQNKRCEAKCKEGATKCYIKYWTKFCELNPRHEACMDMGGDDEGDDGEDEESPASPEPQMITKCPKDRQCKKECRGDGATQECLVAAWTRFCAMEENKDGNACRKFSKQQAGLRMAAPVAANILG